MKHIDLFSGIGGFALAAQTVWGDEYENVLFCDNNKFCRQVIRKNFGKESVIYGDIREITRERVIADTRSDEQRRRGKEVNTAEAGQQTLNNAEKCSDGVTADAKRGRPYTEKDKQELESKGSNEFCVKQPGDIKFQRIDLLTGGFPCQPFSQAGKRRGTDDDRFLWPEMLRVIKEFEPVWVIAENVRGILTIEGGLVFEQVCVDLENAGYSVQAYIIPAVAVNAPHRRDRVWIVAHSNNTGSRTLKPRINENRTQKNKRREELSQHRVDGQNSNVTNPGQQYGEQGNSKRVETDKAKRSTRTIDAKRQNKDVADSKTTKCERSRYSRKRGAGFTDNNSWEQNWLEVATEFCGVYDELPLWVDGYFKKLIGGDFYGTSNKKNRTKDLRILQKAIQQEKVWEKIGRLFSLDDKTVLLKILFRIEDASNAQINLQYQSEESKKDSEVRELWRNAYFMRSSYRREHKEQFAKELKSIVQELSYETSLEISETWYCLQCCHSSLTSPKVELDGFKLTKAGHRVERLKALGNAIVPQVAIEIMRGIKAADQGRLF